jgi:hypothetical protein
MGVRAGLCPDRLLIARHGRGLRSKLLGREMLQVQPLPGMPAWQPGVEALAVALQAQPRPTDVTVVLSNHFVRYATLPWREALGGDAEWHAAARHAFASTHGNAAKQWHIRVSGGKPGSARIASAIDAELLSRLNTVCSEHRCRLVSVQPYFMAAFNRARGSLAGNAWFAVWEPGRLAMALTHRHAWQSVTNRMVSTAPGDIANALLREAALAGADACDKLVFVGERELPPEASAKFRWLDRTLPPGEPPGSSAYAMVLA